MTPLAGALLHLMYGKAGAAPPSDAEVETALIELVEVGRVERFWAHGASHYRLIQTPAAVVGESGIGT